MRNRAHFSSKFTNIRTTKKENQLSIKSISHSVHDPVCLNFLHFILPHSSQRSKKKKRKKLITYLQTVTRIQNPRSSYFSFHSRICRCTVSYRRSPPPPFQPPSKLLGPNLLRARRRSFCTILSLPFPKISTGTARLNSTGSTRVKRNWPRRRPFRGRETGRFHAGKGYAVGRAPHLDARCVHLNRLLSLSFLDARADGIDISVEKRDGGGIRGDKGAPGRARTTRNGPLAKI